MIYKHKNHTFKIIASSLLIAGAVGVWATAKSQPVSAQDSNLTAENSDSSTLKGSTLLNLVDKIESIELDGSIFQDQVFNSLTDRTVDLPLPILGRSNPFAPIPGQSASTR